MLSIEKVFNTETSRNLADSFGQIGFLFGYISPNLESVITHERNWNDPVKANSFFAHLCESEIYKEASVICFLFDLFSKKVISSTVKYDERFGLNMALSKKVLEQARQELLALGEVREVKKPKKQLQVTISVTMLDRVNAYCASMDSNAGSKGDLVEVILNEGLAKRGF